MQQSAKASGSFLDSIGSSIGRILISIAIPALTFIGLWQGFLFLRDSEAPQIVIVLVAIVWGVGGVALLYWVSNWLIEQLPVQWAERIQPYLFVGPAVAILFWYLALPTVRTFWISMWGRDGAPAWGELFTGTVSDRYQFVGLANYASIFTDRQIYTAFQNNIMWIVFGATLAVALGLVIATLADRSKFENIAKAMIFMPMAISMVGAAIIWNLIYEVDPPQVGLLNSIWTNLGGDPVAWTKDTNLWLEDSPANRPILPWNNLFLIVILIWLQTGFAMVLFSAALKGIPGEILEAARVDGATELQIFFQIMIPYIMGTIVTVSTTIIIFTLKIFDIVWVMTGSQFDTQVIATEFYRRYFTANDRGVGSAIAIILLITVIPVMIYNLREFNDREAF